ncbi:MAG TPA: hypothetical protein VFZ48_05200 [Candidatus Saccharimonadales bacterium]
MELRELGAWDLPEGIVEIRLRDFPNGMSRLLQKAEMAIPCIRIRVPPLQQALAPRFSYRVLGTAFELFYAGPRTRVGGFAGTTFVLIVPHNFPGFVETSYGLLGAGV